MIQISEIPALLEQLEDHIADDLEIGRAHV